MPTKIKTKAPKTTVKSTPSKPVERKHKIKWGFVLLFSVCVVLALTTVLTILVDGMINVFVRAPRENANLIKMLTPNSEKGQEITSNESVYLYYTWAEPTPGKIFLVNKKNNNIIWEREWPLFSHGNERPAGLIASDRVYLGYTQEDLLNAHSVVGSLYCFDLNSGESIWTIPGVGGDFYGIYLEKGKLIVATKKYFMPAGCEGDEVDEGCLEAINKTQSGEDMLFAFDATTGEQLWEVAISGYQRVDLPDNSQFLEVTYDQNKKEYYFIEDGTVPPETTMIESDNIIKKDE